MKRLPAVLVLCAVLAGCPESGAERPPANDRDTMTQRQRDSVTATLPIPGAGAVGGALDAADAAAARAAQHDSLLGGRR
ncbi:MAG TPA: hypothetical protein VLA43_06750 [Longimicrobiales bacterium]|nr:hypothetical protein [Longimicrobiales bacterium]